MSNTLRVGLHPCSCPEPHHDRRLVAVTGGPGAGKTAVLEMALRMFCHHVAVLPEAASVVFGGGFPRHDSDIGRRAAQRAIYHVQREMERLVLGEGRFGLAFCDRGTVDGVAYWPASPGSFWRELGTSHQAELGRYAAVVHLRVPPPEQGYNRDYALRIESPEEALALDERIAEAWRSHPHYHEVPADPDFHRKASRALALLHALLPPCCREQVPIEAATQSASTAPSVQA